MEALDEAGMYDAGDPAMSVAAAELLLEGLAAHRRISRAEAGTYSRARVERKKPKGGGFTFGDDVFG